jgi:hypothetical protein
MEKQESLNLNDLKLMAQLIKVVSTRGAIQAEEMAPVGMLYEKLVSFIKATSPPQEVADDKTNEATASTEGN